MSAGLPRVSAIVLSYQFADYLAQSIDSVLAQDYPQELLEVIVVDDGSTDSTPEVLERYGERVRYVRKPNGGLISSVNRGFAEAGGELLALQSGDDIWTPGRLARQVELLQRAPEVGLVYGDMEVIDNELRVLHGSFWAREGITPHRGRPLGALVRSNFVSSGTILVRSSLRERFHPIPEHACWEDWWIAVRVAEVAELDYIAAPLLRYRFHGANMSLGADAERQRAKSAEEMRFRRWLLSDLPLESIDPADLLVGCQLYEHCVAAAAQHRGADTGAVVPREPHDAERAGELVRAGYEQLARGRSEEAVRLAARAFAHDLHDANVRRLLQEAASALAAPPRSPGARTGAPAQGAPAPRSSTRRPRVTLGIATYDRETYLAEAIASSLAQEHDSFEVLLVDDGSRNPAVAEVLAGFDDPRLRVVRHAENRGIAAAYNTIIREGRGELVAMLGDDDVCLPGRLARESAIFERHPDTGVVHGDALVIDAAGRVSGRWDSADFTPSELMRCFVRDHNRLVDPTRMVHRRVYEVLGGYDESYRIAQDLHFWLRAAPRFRFRHCPGGPLIGLRRHGENTSQESARERELLEVERALGEALARMDPRELEPELDWAVIDPATGERRALELLAERLQRRTLALPRLAAAVRERARSLPHPAPVSQRGAHAGQPPRRLMMTAFGWHDSGGGTTVPRLAAKELARRGWEVSVFHAATGAGETGEPYEIVESEEDGVRLLAVHNRAHGLWDLGHPLRELDDPPITAAFAAALERLRPELVHFHNLHNLGAALLDQAAARGLPAFFSTHNYWLICPRAYLLTGAGEMCGGPGDGARCAACVQSPEGEAHRVRLRSIRARAGAALNACLAVSDAVRRTLIGAGYPAEMIDVVRQGMPHADELWRRLGSTRAPGRRGEELTVAFLGSAYPHKGPQLLLAAAQLTDAPLRVQIHGEIPAAFAEQLRAADARGVLELCGRYSPSELERVLAGVDAAALPSMWWDCAPLAAAECMAARVPLIAPRLGGLAEAVADGRDGLLFDGLDAQDLARCLERLAGERGLLERLQGGIAAPRSFGDYVDELEAYYRGERPGRCEEGEGARSAELALRWQGDHGLATSLSIVNSRVSERLRASGAPPIRVQRVTREGAALDPPLAHAADVEVRHQWPPSLEAPASGRLAVILPWEFGAVPREWIGPLRERVDELWVPSEYVRGMYLQAGLPQERVQVVPNGVDLELLHPEGERYELPAAQTRLLFVGGLIWRKGPDVLLDAYRAAFAGREDVLLVVKDVGREGVYRDGEREQISRHAESGALPRLHLIDEELPAERMAALYRACDVLVAPYRGEGFAMPVLEAMACGLPAIVTAGGPTDEFCPPQACWRIRSRRLELSDERVGPLQTEGTPWVLEPDAGHLAGLMLAAAAESGEQLARRGAAAREAAERYGWDEVAERYGARIAALAARPRIAPREAEPWRFEEEAAVRVLATPAWRGEDRLGELLSEWARASTPASSACLYLLADPRVDGGEEDLERRVLACGVELSRAADVTVLLAAVDGEDAARVHRGVDAYVPLHGACAGHERMARAAGSAVLELGGAQLQRLLARAATALQPA